MALTLPGQTLRAIASSLRQLSYLPTSWQGVLKGINADGRSQLEPLLVELTREGATPRLMALMLEQLADQQDALQRERNSWSFVWSGPEALHAKTADTFATVDQLIREATTSLLIATFNIGLSESFHKLLESIAIRLENGSLQRVDLFFHPIQIAERLGSQPLDKVRTWFNEEVWPWPNKPNAFIDTRLINGSRERCYQHSKVLIADAKTEFAKALVTSANFSEPAQRHNFEAGWLTTNAHHANFIASHFRRLAEQNLFKDIGLQKQEIINNGSIQ